MFSFIVPTRHRTEQVRRLLDSVKATTCDLRQIEVVLVIDEDDEESMHLRFDGLTLKRVTVPPGLTMGALNLSGYRAATGDRLMLLNDDVVLQTPGWDEQVRAAFRSFPDQVVLVNVNDLLFRDTLCTFPFLTREFCSLMDGICPPGYLRYRIDDHIHNIFDLLSLLGHHRRIFLPDVIFAHMNIREPEEQGSARYVPDPATHEIDSRLFEALLPERKRIAIQAMHQIEGRLSSEQHSAWQMKLEPVTESIRLREHARWFPSLAVGPEHLPRVTIGIMSADLKSVHARKCVELVRTHTTNYELILVENNQDAAFNLSHGMNRILSVCRTDYLVLMDDHVLVGPGWLEGMLRCVGPDVGLVTPLHQDCDGRLSYAGVVLRPDDTGHHSYILEAPAGPSPIQTLCSAIMLIDIPKCGHLRLDEGHMKYFVDIDYGLRVWEEGFQVVCSPYSRVTHLAGATSEQDRRLPAQLFERLQALRSGVWKSIPEFAAIEKKAAEIDRLVEKGGGPDQTKFLEKSASLVRSLAAYPALQDYLAVRARAGIGERLPYAGDPATGRLAILLGMAGHSILFETGFEGMNIALQKLTYYAWPQDEGAFSYERMAGNGYSRSFEAPSLEGVKALILQHEKVPAGRHIVAGADSAGARAAGAGPRSAPRAADNRSETERLADLVEARNRLIARLSGALAGRGQRASSASRSNPLAHFLEIGAYAGCRPNPLFDPVYYLTENPDVAAAGLNPLAHFLERGAQEGRRPNPLFDTAYYLEENPDVAAAGVNPLAHFLEVGAAQGCKPNPLFDTTYYLQQNPDVAADGINPLAHFLERGAKEGRRPNPLFDTAYYLDQNPDVVESGMNPLAHFLEFGAQEGRRPSPAFDTAGYLHRNPEVAQAGINPLAHFLKGGGESGAFFFEAVRVPLSVVIPTHNRGALLAQTLEACHRNAGGCELEIIVIDDGSTDDTAQRLSALSTTIPDLHWQSVRKVGPARARNIGADAARHDVIVFLGDDIQPLNADFFRIHASLHVRHPAPNLAVLGKVEWPQWGAGRITPTMLHVQGRGGEQFGYSHLTPYQLAGWQYFYTANVSVKKTLVRDWILEGFDTGFSTAAYEDLEFAYRQSQPPKGLRIFYDPGAIAAHHHHYTLPQFMDRQFSAGKALIHLLELHPELAATCNFQEFVEALRGSRDFPAERLLADYQLGIEGVKAWARQLDRDGELGHQPWREAFLSAVLELCLLDGFLSAWPQRDANLAAARALLLYRFRQRIPIKSLAPGAFWQEA